MTDRVEIKPDDTSETLEQSAEKLQKEGVDVSKDAAINKDGETATLTEVKKEVPQETRPDWLPEKFTSAAEMAKAYGELEKQFSSRPKEEVQEDV